MPDRDGLGLENYYKDLYESEVKKREELTRELVRVEEENAELHRKIDTLKSSFMFKLIKPFRNMWARLKNAFIRVKRYGNLRNVIEKLKSKRVEMSAYKRYGTRSLPDEETRKAQENHKFSEEHIFSILVPLYNTPEKYLREMIESVTAQTYSGWQLVLSDGSDDEHPEVGRIVREYIDKDAGISPTGKSRIAYKKIKNQGISGNTNECYEMVEGDYIGLCDHDDLLHPCALFYYMQRIEETGADFIYCDEATFRGESINNMITLHFKPEFAIDNLCANNYICHFSVFKKSLAEEAGPFRSECDGAQDHDMILRLTARAKRIEHVPKILYYWRSHEGSTAADINAKTYAIEAAKRAVGSYLESKGFEGFEIESTKAFATIFRIRYALKEKAKISIIIPSCDHAGDLKRCVDSIITRSSYDNYEIVVVENNSTDEKTFQYYEELKKAPVVKVVTYEAAKGEGFNFSKLINFGAANSSGEYLLLLNNDTEVITRDWLEELLMFAQREDVGAVGCKLYYEDYSIQHAGIVIGLGAHRTAGHTHYRLSKDNLGYMGRLWYAQDVSAVTGACLMVSRKDFDEAGGLDESFAVALNDVDFCLRLRQKGRLNIFTPFAELFHYESASRGNDTDGSSEARSKRYDEEAERFRSRWKKELEQGDPYYNPNFSLDYSNYRLETNVAMVSD
ncbi:MAG: glycosyltransferase family 2 protein [Lachnospiraceae bacterium]|nr:glycosyltransferase family 2 protein [Lachnospiraceae bacterium]